MKITRFPFWIIVFVLLAGCSGNPAPPLLHGTQAGQTEAFLPEPTQSFPTAGISPTPQANQFHLQTHCPDAELGIRNLPDLSGTLVFSADNGLSRNSILSPQSGKRSMLSFWNPQSDRISTYKLEEGQAYYYYAEAPNKEKLAFTEGKTTTISLDLIVLNNQGEELGRLVVPDDWTFFHWLNNDQLLLQRFTAKEKFDLLAVNLSDKEQHTLPTIFPDIYLNELFWDWGSQILFNPKSTMVLYPIRQYNPSQVYTVLWNVKENKQVARIAGSGWARWSPDGSRFMLVSDLENSLSEKRNEILLINASGEQSRATFLTKYYEQLWIEQPVWSPDNRYIAFWLITQYPVKSAKLGVLDTETLTVDIFCKEIVPRPLWFGDDIASKLGYAVARVDSAIPIWSPDSHYLLIEDHNDVESSAFIFDLRNYTMTKITDRAKPVGWLK